MAPCYLKGIISTTVPLETPTKVIIIMKYHVKCIRSAKLRAVQILRNSYFNHFTDSPYPHMTHYHVVNHTSFPLHHVNARDPPPPLEIKKSVG